LKHPREKTHACGESSARCHPVIYPRMIRKCPDPIRQCQLLAIKFRTKGNPFSQLPKHPGNGAANEGARSDITRLISLREVLGKTPQMHRDANELVALVSNYCLGGKCWGKSTPFRPFSIALDTWRVRPPAAKTPKAFAKKVALHDVKRVGGCEKDFLNLSRQCRCLPRTEPPRFCRNRSISQNVRCRFLCRVVGETPWCKGASKVVGTRGSLSCNYYEIDERHK
jgi:hypothetical protein